MRVYFVGECPHADPPVVRMWSAEMRETVSLLKLDNLDKESRAFRIAAGLRVNQVPRAKMDEWGIATTKAGAIDLCLKRWKHKLRNAEIWAKEARAIIEQAEAITDY